MQTPSQTIRDSAQNLPQSATAYREVTFPGNADYAPETPFKGILLDADGAVSIVGVDGHKVTLTLAAGLWPLGGIKIAYSGTSPTTGITALF